MADRRNERLVYSTAVGRVCGGCGWPTDNCRCSKKTASAAVPEKVVAKLRMEKKGRGGKTVTVVYDLPDNSALLDTLARELKRAYGTGGAVVENTIELQGELRERVREFLIKKGFQVKG